MKLSIKTPQWIFAIALTGFIAACSENADVANVSTQHKPIDAVALDVYKSPTCGCCGDWVTHVEAAGFNAALHHPSDLNQLKTDQGVAPRYRSCHTAVSQDGYVFEGHVPADIMQRFLANPPEDALGLAVPGMPVGSPGMEMGDRFDSYDVWLLTKSGRDRVYQHIAGKR